MVFEEILIVVTLFLLSAVSFSILRELDLLVSVCLMSMFSVLMALLYVWLGAVDVAITESSVGALFSSVIMLLALSFVRSKKSKSPGSVLIPILVVFFVACSLCGAGLELTPIGISRSEDALVAIKYYANYTSEHFGIPNIVTAILACFRAYDTLGETIVILVAAIGVRTILSGLDVDYESEREKNDG